MSSEGKAMDGTAQYGDEGFGDPDLLPNRSYCESCAAIAHVLWQHRMNLLRGDLPRLRRCMTLRSSGGQSLPQPS